MNDSTTETAVPEANTNAGEPKATKKRRAKAKDVGDAVPATTEPPAPTEPAPAADAPAPDAPSEPEAAAREPKPKAKKAAKADATLADVGERYLAWLEDEGKSGGTIASYRGDLAVALDELGAETRIGALTSRKVAAFNRSDRVCKTAKGKAKSPLSIAKTKRVLAQMLRFAESKGYVETAPIPAD